MGSAGWECKGAIRWLPSPLAIRRLISDVASMHFFYRIPHRLAVSLIFCLGFNMASAVEDAFPRTPPGETEVKVLPPGLLIETTADSGDYFDHNNRLFRNLFRYIRDHDIAMTAPVEAGVRPATMAFWVGEGDRDKVAGDQGPVRVIEVEERLVAARGARGGYSQSNFERTRDQLLEWVAAREDLEPTGEPYAVYWNSPFVPWFLKQSEVHLPVSRLKAETLKN